jgi:hypothetical protein
MDGLRRYAHARVQARTKKMFFILQRCISLFYNIFLRCILLLIGHMTAVSSFSGCQPWNKVWKACINTNFVQDEPEVSLKINLIVVAMFGTWVSVMNISVLKFHTVLALCFRFHIYLRNFYAILNSVNNMFLCKLVFTWNCINVVINNIVLGGQLLQRIVFLCVHVYLWSFT